MKLVAAKREVEARPMSSLAIGDTFVWRAARCNYCVVCTPITADAVWYYEFASSSVRKDDGTSLVIPAKVLLVEQGAAIGDIEEALRSL